MASLVGASFCSSFLCGICQQLSQRLSQRNFSHAARLSDICPYLRVWTTYICGISKFFSILHDRISNFYYMFNYMFYYMFILCLNISIYIHLTFTRRVLYPEKQLKLLCMSIYMYWYICMIFNRSEKKIIFINRHPMMLSNKNKTTD